MSNIKQFVVFLSIVVFFSISECALHNNQLHLFRNPIDSVGFPIYAHQVDSFMKIMDFKYSYKLKTIEDSINSKKVQSWKAIIVPHDDYAYVQYIYPAALKNVKAKTVFIIGVAHKAKLFNMEDRLVFDSHKYWNAPYGKIRVSKFRENLMESLDKSYFIVHDSLQELEHSVEPFLPVLQYFHHDFEIVPILVPYMSMERMKEISVGLAKSIYHIAERNHLSWGKDFAIIISSDAVHYGDMDWGEKNYAQFGIDLNSYKMATAFDKEIISDCFLNGISEDKIQQFVNYTVWEDNHKEYKWTWCGRYSIPFGLLTCKDFEAHFGIKLKNRFTAYSTSIENPPLLNSVKELGITAPANLRHWVGYACIAYD